MLPAATDINYAYCRLYLRYKYEMLVGVKRVLLCDAFIEKLRNIARACNHFWIWTSFRVTQKYICCNLLIVTLIDVRIYINWN